MDQEIVDVVIVGAGPAGLQAALHAARKKTSVIVLGKSSNSAIYPAHVENYLCVDGVTDGADLLKIAVGQAKRFGAQVKEEDVLSIGQNGVMFAVKTDSSEYIARALILATGTSRKKLKVEGEKRLFGRGVSYCVDCDANFYRNSKVAVVGNGSAAVDGALTLLGYASEVSLIAKELNISAELKKKLVASDVVVKQGTWVKKIQGENEVESLLLDDDSELILDGVFIELGAKSAVELAVNLGVMLDMETMTHIDTDKKQATNIAGIYSAGDIAGQPYQMAKAVGEGCVAGWEAANYANKQKREEMAS